MMDFLIYDAKVAVLIAVFYMFYRLMLARETFHRTNRVVLLLTAVASFVLPLCVITMHETLMIDYELNELNELTVSENISEISEIRSEETPWWQIVLPILFIIGMLVTLGHTLMSMFRILMLIKRSEKHPQPDGTTICVSGNAKVPPFSWMHYIVMNQSDYAEQNAAILAHERGHIRLKHSWDLLLVDTLTALQWFNPAMWMLRSDLRAIHEYEADGAVLSLGINARQYQYLLITKAASIGGYSLANGISHSTLKNRINMMLHKKSNQTSLLKLLALVPIVGITLALNAKTVTHYVYEEPQKQQPVKKGNKAGTIKMGNQEIQVVENNKPVTFQTVLVPDNYPMDGVPIEVVVDGKVIQTTKTDAKGKITLTPPIGATVRFITKMIEEDPYSDNVTETADIKEVVITKELLEQSGIKTISFGNTEEKTFDVVEQMPQFPGGSSKLFEYLAKNIRYPAEAEKAGAVGRVIVSFVVEKDGSISDAKTVKAIHPALDAEALRVINSMPKWIPGKQKGEATRVKYVVPVTFRLQGKDAEFNGSLKYDDDSKDNNHVGEVVVVGYGDQKPTVERVHVVNTFKAPYIIVDGKPIDSDKLKDIDPKTIERMDVLKDKAAIEMYGEKAKNGVIVITMKKK